MRSPRLALFLFASIILALRASHAAPIATTQPQSQTIAAGASATFTAAFSGAANLQWFKDTLPIPGATSPTLTLPSVSTADAGDYWLRATDAKGAAETQTAALVVLTAGAELRITEFLASNDGGIRDEDGSQEDWIEIQNPSTAAVSTAGWKLTNDPAQPAKWALPAQTIPAGGSLIVFASSKDRAIAGAELHANFKISSAAGGYLALVRPDNSLATVFSSCPAQYADTSYGLTATGAPKYLRLPTPGAPNVDGMTVASPAPLFSAPGGTFTGALNVAISTGVTGGTLRYTTDGRLPTFDSPTCAAPVALTGSTQLRAAVVFPGERYGASATAAYLRLGADVAAFTSPLPIVVLHNFGSGAVPGVSSRGPYGDGSGVVEVAKQAVALTILDEAAGNTAFGSAVVTTTRAGVRLRGSSSFSFPRKSYALETWNEINEQSRDVPLLGMPADDDWVLYAPNPGQYDKALFQNSLIYELARQAGYNAPRTRFVELFLNTTGGDITMADSRGLYLLVEKPKRGKERVNFKYLNANGTAGGWMINSDRMDSLPAGSAPGSLVPRHFHTAGPDRILQTEDDNARGYSGAGGGGLSPARDDLPNFYHSFFNFESPKGWDITPAQRAPIQAQMRAFDAALYGPNYKDPVNGYAPHIDRANWAAFLALNCFAKNQDAVVLSTYFFRETPSSPIKCGPLWDFDRAFASNGSATSSLTWAHDRLFYPRLMSDPDFAQAYIDAWQQMRRGAFTTANMQAVVDAQAAEITSAVAARSGTTASTWTSNVATLRTWVADRAAALDALYTAPASFSQNGGDVPAGFQLAITAPAGTIYFTTDGSDPRLPGGGVAPGAQIYSAAIPITADTTVFARVKNGSAWSGTTVAAFHPPQDLQTLRVTEIYYNPPGAGAVSGDEFEFLELQNTGLVQLALGGLSFSGITYVFPAGTTLAPGAYFLLARNQAQLAARFPGAVANGIYTGKLDNGGEEIALLRDASVIWSFTYDDAGDWPVEADGGGMSLQQPDPAAPGYDAATWTAAAPTPGASLSLADSDGDGMPDYWETLYALTDPAADEDGDGATNLAEYIAGTNPRNPASVLRLTASPSAAGATLNLEFRALAGRAYTVQYRDDLAAGTWQRYLDFPAEAATYIKKVEAPLDTPHRFFRVITHAMP